MFSHHSLYNYFLAALPKYTEYYVQSAGSLKMVFIYSTSTTPGITMDIESYFRSNIPPTALVVNVGTICSGLYLNRKRNVLSPW